MLAALWGRMQGWLLMLGAALLVLAGAYVAGGRAARRAAQADDARRQIAAGKVKDESAAEIDRLDDSGVRDRARRRMRAGGR